MSKVKDYPLRNIFGWGRAGPNSDVAGIEIEVEGGPWPEDPIRNWRSIEDHSLRNNGREFVIHNPVRRDAVRANLEVLKAALANAELSFSYRTSVHVHINVRDLTVREWCNFVALYTTLEELLSDEVGPSRAGNRFCLRMIDADVPLSNICSGLQSENLGLYINDDIKYAGMNLLATCRLGTLEFRSMEGNLDVDRITAWVDTLFALKDRARALASPVAVAEGVSRMGPRAWVADILPDTPLKISVLRRNDITQVVYEGVRLAQELAYCIDWGDKPEKIVQEEQPPQPARLRERAIRNIAIDEAQPLRVNLNDLHARWAIPAPNPVAALDLDEDM